jgi:hypothetical protein
MINMKLDRSSVIASGLWGSPFPERKGASGNWAVALFSLPGCHREGLTNLEDRKEEMTALQASSAAIAKMEALMRQGLPLFRVNETREANRGQVDVIYHFQQSRQSDAVYLNRYSVAHNLGKQLQEGQQYLVITPGTGAKNEVKKLENITEAIALFKERGPKTELAVGKDAANKVTIASMEEGKVNYVNKDYRGTYYGKFVSQTIWPEKGKGFSVPQSAQLIQGYSVFRDDLVNFKTGEVYAAWVKLDMDKGVGKSGNFDLQQYHVPQYGFELAKVLDEYKIKELADPPKREEIERKIENGFTPLVTVEKDGQPLKVLLEASPRYGKMNFYNLDGKIEKREQFEVRQLEVQESKAAEIFAKKDIAKEAEQTASMGIDR